MKRLDVSILYQLCCFFIVIAVVYPLQHSSLPVAHAASIAPAQPPAAPIQVQQWPLLRIPTACPTPFLMHELDHTTHVLTQGNPLLESNGAGLAINDLDNDGYLDLVLANLDGTNSIFWNQGKVNGVFAFHKEPLFHGDSRAVNIVDYDGDGWQDIFFTRRRLAPPVLWRNLRGEGQAQFVWMHDLFTEYAAYSAAWADLDGDNDLDLVTGAYDIEQEKLAQAGKLLRGHGVVYYENQGDNHFTATQLIPLSQALALLLTDLNGDNRLDILVGNDFHHPDQLWLRQEDAWVTAKLFAATSQNTMSLESGDLDNDGQTELFAADMKPYANEDLAAWAPMMENMVHDPFQNDPQIMANVLQARDQSGQFQETAVDRGIDGTGWSWSAKFGDLDNDGFLDLYVVNGMIDPKLFGHLPNAELVEENQAFRNNGQGGFTLAPAWGLNAITSGRGMSMADLDNDGDLDVVVNNFQSPTQVFENRLCGGAGLEVELYWPQSRNSRAIGAQLTLHTTTGSYRRTVRSASGYLSGDPARIHFGLPPQSIPALLEIRWPDGAVSTVLNPTVQTLLLIVR